MNAVSREENLLPKRARLKAKRRVIIKEEPTSSSSHVKLVKLVKTMKGIMEMIILTDRDPRRDNQGGPPIRNPKFRKSPPQIK